MNLLKNLLIFGSGVGVGAGLSIIIMKKMYLDELDERIEDVRRDYEARENSGIAEKLAKMYKNDEEEEEKVVEKAPLRPKKTKKAPTDYTSAYNTDKNAAERRKNAPQIIDINIFSTDDGYEKESYSVFRQGMTFINVETDIENSSMARKIGQDILTENDDVDELYLRFEKDQKDVELIFHDCSYLDWLKEERD